MVEWDGAIDGPPPIGYPIHVENLERDIYRLICVFGASSTIAALSKKAPGPVLTLMRQSQELLEASRLLLSIAVTVRSIWDVQPQYAEFAVPKSTATVGKLVKDLEEAADAAVDLPFREACNKVIHALRIRFDLPRKLSAAGIPPLNPIVYLYGEHHGKLWKATVNVYDFARCAAAV